MLTKCKQQVEAKTASINLTWFYFYLHSSIRLFCTLFNCFVLDGLLQSICYRMFCSKHSIIFEKTYVLTFFTSNLNSVNFSQQ